jgi:hypothetical protein
MMEDPSILQGGRRPFRGVGSKLAEALIVFVVSIPVAIVVPYLFIQLVASAQNACFDVEAGQGFYLMVTWFELVIVGVVLFWAGALITWHLHLVVRLAAGLVLLFAVCLFATWQLVPWGPSTDYPATTAGQCGPGGVPTWWPPMLPHH